MELFYNNNIQQATYLTSACTSLVIIILRSDCVRGVISSVTV